MTEFCSKLTIKTPKQWRSGACIVNLERFGVFIVNFEQISHCSGNSTADFEQVNAGWNNTFLNLLEKVKRLLLP